MEFTIQHLVSQLVPRVPGVRLTDTVVLPDLVVLRLAATAPSADCPICQRPSQDRHSRYTRTLADLPWSQHTVQLLLTVRKFRCPNRACPRRVFTERLPALAAPYARKTQRCQGILRAIGLALGGQAGAQLAGQLGLSISRDSLLRLVQRTPLPTYFPPRVVGTDDWSRRRGHHFGSIVVDLERQQPLALLPDRQPATVIAWLQRHPTIEVVSRDRADGYAEAIRRGAPHVQQIADRWHLLKNLTETLETWLHNKRTAIKAALPAPRQTIVALEAIPIPQEPNPKQEAARALRQARHGEKYEQIQRLHAKHLEVATIARQADVSRMTVYKYLRMTEPPVVRQPVSRTAQVLEAYRPYLLQRWSEGRRNAQQLWREIRTGGYAYSARTVNRYLTELRRACGEKPNRFRDAARQDLETVRQKAERQRPPSVKQVARLFTARDHYRSAEQRAYLTRLCEQDQEIAVTYEFVQRFTAMVRRRTGAQLPQWLAEVTVEGNSELQRFGRGLQTDLAAVQAGLTERWSQGQVEGQINRLKFLKRQGYGRARFALLQQRVLQRPRPRTGNPTPAAAYRYMALVSTKSA
jgi:transposase